MTRIHNNMKFIYPRIFEGSERLISSRMRKPSFNGATRDVWRSFMLILGIKFFIKSQIRLTIFIEKCVISKEDLYGDIREGIIIKLTHVVL